MSHLDQSDEAVLCHGDMMNATNDTEFVLEQPVQVRQEGTDKMFQLPVGSIVKKVASDPQHPEALTILFSRMRFVVPPLARISAKINA